VTVHRGGCDGVSRHAAPVPPRGPLRWWVTAAVLLLTATGCLTVGLRAHQVALADPSPPTSMQAVSPLAFSPVAAQPVGAPGGTAVGALMPGPVALQPLPETPSATGPVPPAGSVSAASVGEAVTPVSLRIPAIGVATTLGELGLNPDRTVQVPTDFTQPGWFGLGPVPGQLGSAVILGHVDSYQGPAVFFRLGSLHTGDQVEVALTNKTVAHFGVTTVTTYPKEQFPAQLVYAPHGGSTLNLVTCGGEFDTHTRSYLSNVVVTTTLTALTTSPS